MSVCSHCGHSNVEDAKICQNCGMSLDENSIPPPRLLAQIQGLIPPEPIISTGKIQGRGRWRKRQAIPPEDESEIPGSDDETTDEISADAAIPATVVATEIVKEQTTAKKEAAARKLLLPVLLDPQPTAPPSPGHRSMLLLVFGLLFVLLILLAQWLPQPAGVFRGRRPAVEMAYTYIELLPPQATVLIAWDYEPTTQGEMQLLAVPILQHLQDKGARIINMSLRPTGPSVAAAAYAQNLALAPPRDRQTRALTVSLGYIPGEAAALRALAVNATNTTDLPSHISETLDYQEDEPLQSNINLIVEFSAETTTTREWVEQIASKQEVPLIVAASGAIAPTLRPYEQTGQIAALLAGYTDALAYEQLVKLEGPAARQVNAQSLLHILFIAIVVAAIVHAVRRNDPQSP